jgi:hypothetical protein
MDTLPDIFGLKSSLVALRVKSERNRLCILSLRFALLSWQTNQALLTGNFASLEMILPL